MFSSGAVVLVLRDAAASPDLPLMLKNILFSPAARWLSMSLQRFGIERFFVVAEDDLLPLTAACFPVGAEVVSVQDKTLNDRLMAFASSLDGKLIAVTEPVWLSDDGLDELVNEEFLTPAGDAMGVYRVDAAYVAQGGVDTLNYGEYYSPLNDPDIRLLPLTREADLRKARQLGLADTLGRLMESGVDIIDPNTVWAESGAVIGPGSVILPNTILRGQVTAGSRCSIGPNSMLTECVLGDDCSVNASQVAFQYVPDGTGVGPFESL